VINEVDWIMDCSSSPSETLSTCPHLLMIGGYRPNKRILDHYIIMISQDRTEETINLSEKRSIFIVSPFFKTASLY
jgi:hypothetical protein